MVRLQKRKAEDERKRLRPKGGRVADTNLHFADSRDRVSATRSGRSEIRRLFCDQDRPAEGDSGQKSTVDPSSRLEEFTACLWKRGG